MVQLLIFLIVISRFCYLNAVLYDCYSGKPVTKEQLRIYKAKNNIEICTVDVKPCDPDEWRRVDGSCNNLKHPSRGTHRTPTIKLLSQIFSPNYEPRKAANGEELPMPRKVRTHSLHVGKSSDLKITQLFSYYLLYLLGDVNSINDILNHVVNITHCCKPEGKKDYMCTPNEIPADDPVHRYSGISCMNLTRPQSFQSFGCLEHGTNFARMVFQTPLFDLSNTYNVMPEYIPELRTYRNGLLKIDKERNGLLFPPSNPESIYCFLNRPPRETRCHKYHANNVLGPNIFNIIFYRQHNEIAKELHKLNPYWDDEQLFFTAKDINIAIGLQIFFYEMLPVVFGRKNMIRDGIISCDKGFRDLYDENLEPMMTDEYVYVQRWFHTMQETDVKLYDKDGYYLKTIPYVNFTTRTGYIALDNNMQECVQGAFRQKSGAFDYTFDFDIVDRILGGIHLSADVATSDVHKARLLGFQGYLKYKEFCTKRCYKTFSDLKDSMSLEHIHRLKQLYKDPRDIDLITGIWFENFIKGGKVPETLYCLMTLQLKRSIAFDRHWYERPNRPHAFTAGQLEAIRNVTIAGVLCDAGGLVTEIQPRAFYTISSKNPLTKCSSSKIGKLDLTPWRDPKCDKGA